MANMAPSLRALALAFLLAVGSADARFPDWSTWESVGRNIERGQGLFRRMLTELQRNATAENEAKLQSEIAAGRLDEVDEELFARARQVEAERVQAGGEEAGPKVALLFLTRGGLPLERLWERWIKGHEDLYSIYIHAATPGYVYNQSTTNATMFHGRQIPSVRAQWGGLGLLRAERRLLASALADPRNQHFVLLSERCAPIWPAPYIHKYLLEDRVSYAGSAPTKFRWTKSFLPEIPAEKWRKGSQWFAIIRDHAMAVINDTVIYNTLLHKHRDKTLDEHYIQTLLPMLDEARLQPRPVTYVEWNQIVTNHPHTFSMDELDTEHIARLRKRTTSCKEGLWSVWSPEVPCTVRGKKRHCYLFARKFSGNETPKLLEIGEKLQMF